MAKFFINFFIFLSSSIAFSQEYTFNISSIKGITPKVDRYYDIHGNAFATVFCREDAASAMIVDNGPLDGKNFFFENPEQCENSKREARENITRCQVELVVDLTDNSAQIISKNCN